MTLDSKTFRGIFITNIVALVGAAIALTWNAAILTDKIERLNASQERMYAVQVGQLVEHEKLSTRVTNDEAARLLLDGRVFRLEDLNLINPR